MAGCMRWEDMCLFAEAIYKHTDSIIPIRLWEFTYEINRDNFTWLLGDFVRLERRSGLVPMTLGALTSFTTINIHPDITLDSRPPVVSCDQLLGFVATRVSCKWSVMVHADDVFTQLGVLGNIDPPLPGKNTVVIPPEWVSFGQSLGY